MTQRDRIDGVLIEPEESGFHLILSGEERDYNFTLDQQTATELHAAVATEITPWLLERDQAKRQIARTFDIPEAFVCNPDESGGYDTSDPKHPDYHDTMSEVWDSRPDK